MANVIPIYLLIGDDLIVGKHCDETFTGALESPTLTNTARSTDQRIYDRSTTSVVAYNAHDNSNTSGTAPACLLYTSPSPRDQRGSRMPSSA